MSTKPGEESEKEEETLLHQNISIVKDEAFGPTVQEKKLPHHSEMESTTHDAFKKAKNYASKKARKVCTIETIYNRLPIINWVKNYNLGNLSGDLVAGFTCALTVIPQGIGYAPLAGLPLQYGLYASIVPPFAYAILGTIKETTVGPTAVNAMMSLQYAGASPIRSLTLSFFCGLIEILAGILNLGCLLSFISAPVISAFQSAISIQVATSQVKGLLGLKVPGRGFLKTWTAVFSNITLIKPYDAALGFCCIGILLFLRKIKELRWFEGTDLESKRARILRKIKWAISIARNSMVVLVSAIIAYIVTDVFGKDAFSLTGDVQGGLPSWQLPWEFNRNSTENSLNPFDMVEDFGIGLLMLPLVSILQHLAIAKFYTPSSKKMDASQEIVALGACQFIGSFIGSMPITASFGRSAINSASGVQTPLSGFVTGAIILATCAFLTPHFAYIPTSALAAVIICAMIFTIEVEILLPIWRSKKADMVPWLLTFLIGLFVSPDKGMIVGIIVHLLLLVYNAGSPKVEISLNEACEVPYLLVRPDRALYFPCVETIRTKLTSFKNVKDVESNDVDEKTAIIMDFSNVCTMDYTAAKGIRALSKELKKLGRPIYFCSVNESIEGVLQGADSTPLVVYFTIQEAEQKLRNSS